MTILTQKQTISDPFTLINTGDIQGQIGIKTIRFKSRIAAKTYADSSMNSAYGVSYKWGDYRGIDMATIILRLPTAKNRTGLSRSTIYLRISEGTFP